MPRKSKKSIEEPIVEVSKKVTKRTIKIPSAIAENLRKVETVDTNEPVVTTNTVKIETSIVNEENTVIEPVVNEVKKQKRTLHLNIGKQEQKTETPVASTVNTNIEEDAFLDEPYLFNFEISNKKEEKEKNEPIINLNSAFFYEPSVFEKYSIDVTETDSPDTVVNLNELIQNNDSYAEEYDDDYVDEEIIEEAEVETAPSLNDIISIDDETESIEDILSLTSEDYDEIIEEEYDDEIVDEIAEDIQEEIIEEEYDEEIVDEIAEDIQEEIIEEEYDEEIVNESSEDIQGEIIEEEYDEDYEDIVDENATDIKEEIIEEEYDDDYNEIVNKIVDEIDEIIEDNLYENISENKEFDINLDSVSNIINVNFDNNFVDEAQEENEYIEEYDDEVMQESADNLDVPGNNDVPVGKLIENQEGASPLFAKPKSDGISHIFKKFSYDDTDTTSNENNINNILGTQNNLSDIHQVLGTFEAKEQKQVTELDVTAEPVGVTIPVIEADTDILSGETNFSGNYESENNGDILNILSPEAPSTNYTQAIDEEYDEIEEEYVDEYDEINDIIEELESSEDYEEVDEYVEETNSVQNVEQLSGLPTNDISALTKMFESFSETISTLSNRIAELEAKNSNQDVETAEEIDNSIEITNDVEEIVNEDVEITDDVEEIVNEDVEITDDVEEIVNEDVEITDDVEEIVNEDVEITDDIEEIVNEDVEITDDVEEIVNEDVEITDDIEEVIEELENEKAFEEIDNIEAPELENTINDEDPSSDFLKILDSLSQTISELENSASLDKETMENEFTTIDDLVNSFTTNSEILEPVTDDSNEKKALSVEEIVENIEPENDKKLFEVIDDGDYNDSSKFYKQYVPPTVEDNKTLYISEETQKVYFPYTSQDIIEKLNDPLKGYSSVEEVINNEYTVPLSEFRKPVISRFKEAYNFMRTKEKGSISESFDLALELMFNSELDPAIIRAAKDLNELDKYLDCLNEDQLGKFDSFKIKYKKLKKHHKK